MHAYDCRCRCRPRGRPLDWSAREARRGDVAGSAGRFGSRARHCRLRAKDSLPPPMGAALAAPALLAMGFPTDLGRSVGSAAAQFLGKPGAPSGTGRCLGAQMAPALGPPCGLVSPRPAPPVIGWEKRMPKSILAATVAALLSTGAPASHAAAATIPSALAAANAGPVQKTAVVCGSWGCRRAWPGRHWGWPWDSRYRPACPLGYYFACRRGPLGYGQCACWPYWTR